MPVDVRPYCALNHSCDCVQTVTTVWFSTAPVASRLSRHRGLWRMDKRTLGGGGWCRCAFTRDQMTWHLDDYRRSTEQWGAVFGKQRPETSPRKLSGSMVANHRGGGESLVVITTLLFLTTSTSATCWHRFTDVPAGSDFRCPMCTSAEP